MDKNRRHKILRLAGLIFGLAVFAAFTVLAVLWGISLREPGRLARFQQQIAALGAGGWFVLLVIQVVQIIVAFIPGGPIQMVAGALYGPFWGSCVCIVGTLLAASAIFPLVKRFGHKVIRLFVDNKDITQYKFLRSQGRVEKLVLVLFFIPGTPKDALTYLFALTPIPSGRFLLLSTAARLPAMLTSVLAGDSFAEGQWQRALLLFLAMTALSAAGLLLQRRIKALYRSHRQK